MDNFKGLDYDNFIEYFKVDLFSRPVLDQHFYPHDVIENDILNFHLQHCKAILNDFILNSVYEQAWSMDFEIKDKDALKLFKMIVNNLQDRIEDEINAYLRIVKINPVNL
ncbi:hypothetical protein LPB87_10045 [Flavobacterium sp. EDS]|uniref:hypothetical protein n=1 Tax=Flavobacterium sp. EDS TaxID=2897328 RepID=UPI001E41FC17|nr:hypothetical protein [Flavobacterium sp. EDS]MCD0474730.1 hypothetical protein [Flavobacterium sp. EDS]